MLTQKIMEVDEGINSVSDQSYPMNGGDGPHSYSNNSHYQRRLIEASKDIINEAIEGKLEIDSRCVNGSKAFGIADLGCSVGKNTFMAVENIIEAVEKEYKAKKERNSNSSEVEFQVFFNDHSNNDFNSLFRSVPYNNSSRKYYAAAVAGSFYGRLFPNSTLHFVNCSCALNWMSKVPKQVLDRESPAWNGNRIHYTTSSEKVHEAYAAQFKHDMECFLSVRAQELVCGGLMLILMPGQSSHYVSQTPQVTSFWLLESNILEMVKQGSIIQKQVEGFNIPVYFPTLKELEEITKNSENFSIERMGILSGPKGYIKPSVEFLVGSIRAAMEEILKQHFGDEVIEDLFELYAKKVAQNLDIIPNFGDFEDLFVILKRKMN